MLAIANFTARRNTGAPNCSCLWWTVELTDQLKVPYMAIDRVSSVMIINPLLIGGFERQEKYLETCCRDGS